MPSGAWIAIPVLMVWGGVGGMLVVAMLSSLVGPWPVVGAIAFFLALYHWRRQHRRRTRGVASLPIGAIILVPVLFAASVVCVSFLVAALVSLVAGS